MNVELVWYPRLDPAELKESELVALEPLDPDDVDDREEGDPVLDKLDCANAGPAVTVDVVVSAQAVAAATIRGVSFKDVMENLWQK